MPSNNNKNNKATANNHSNKDPGVTHGHTLFCPRAVDTTDEEVAQLRAEGGERVTRREQEQAEAEAANRAETRSMTKARGSPSFSFYFSPIDAATDAAYAAALDEITIPRTSNPRR
ncbi:hypothetical protein D6C99_10262 [Aureobasidium pullulans]|nr:hypothetical protein D6D29_10345 [Aureobasidium pullulans]THY35453.1 hypothetical protein D6C99_10262 [Aureobasidium pullulans]